jgi:hypothetical protein
VTKFVVSSLLDHMAAAIGMAVSLGGGRSCNRNLR